MDSTAFGKREFRYSYLFKCIMKHTITLASSLFLFYFKSLGQNITLSLKKAPLEKVFRQIEKQSPFRFVYSQETLQNTIPVSLEIHNGTVEQVLTICFNNQPATFSINDKVIMVKARAVKREPADSTEYRLITGSVTTEQGEALEGATVAIKGRAQATATDRNGNFLLQTYTAPVTLIVTNIGYTTEEIIFKGKSPLLAKLKSAINTLDETVVTGYGKTTRRLNTGNISSVTAEEIGKQRMSNPLAALEGRVPGLLITESNGYPGSSFKVQLRGQSSIGLTPGILPPNDPLFVINGVGLRHIPILLRPNC